MSTEDLGQTSWLSIFQFERKRSKVPDSAEQAMAMLDAQIAQIRGDLESMKMENIAMVARVQAVSTSIDKVAIKTKVESLTMISEDEMTTKNVSTSSDELNLLDSKRDSGCALDMEFETDCRKISIPNNLLSSTKQSSKTRSTSAIDFIKNDLTDSSSERDYRLKATSCDRLSCYSDSALLSLRGFRHPLIHK
jgi:hypothetical protein